MIEKLLKIMYNNNNKKESDVNKMELKLFNAQISIFMTDGIMNPSRYSDKINKSFSKIFTEENMILNIPNAPDEMPLVQFSSKDSKYQYYFARKRLNFYVNFLNNGDEKDLEDYMSKTYKFLKNELLPFTRISRIGIAVNYYYDVDDNPPTYWIKKLELPYSCNSSVDILYTINNKFDVDGLKYNNILSLSNTNIENTKLVPSLSIDISNESVEELNDVQLEYIFSNLDLYKSEVIQKVIESPCNVE